MSEQETTARRKLTSRLSCEQDGFPHLYRAEHPSSDNSHPSSRTEPSAT